MKYFRTAQKKTPVADDDSTDEDQGDFSTMRINRAPSNRVSQAPRRVVVTSSNRPPTLPKRPIKQTNANKARTIIVKRQQRPPAESFSTMIVRGRPANPKTVQIKKEPSKNGHTKAAQFMNFFKTGTVCVCTSACVRLYVPLCAYCMVYMCVGACVWDMHLCRWLRVCIAEAQSV